MQYKTIVCKNAISQYNILVVFRFLSECELVSSQTPSDSFLADSRPGDLQCADARSAGCWCLSPGTYGTRCFFFTTPENSLEVESATITFD